MATVDSITSVLSTLKLDPTISIGEIFNVVILGATLIVLIIYIVATVALWKEAHFQSHLSISPFLLFEIEDQNQFFVRNVGNSAAFNIAMETLHISIRDTPKKKLFQLIFDEINLIESKDRKPLTFKNYLDGKETTFDISAHLNPKYQKKSNYQFTLSYTNPIGSRYFTRFQAGKNGIRVTKISRARLRHRIVFWLERKANKVRLKWWGHRLT